MYASQLEHVHACLQNDYMVLKLDRPVSDTIPIPPLNSDPNVPADGASLTAVGFGADRLMGDLSDVLQMVQLPYIDFETCQRQLALITEISAETNLRAGGEGRNVCTGDNGA